MFTEYHHYQINRYKIEDIKHVIFQSIFHVQGYNSSDAQQTVQGNCPHTIKYSFSIFHTNLIGHFPDHHHPIMLWDLST